MPEVMVMMKKENRRESRVEEDMLASLPRGAVERLPFWLETRSEHGRTVEGGALSTTELSYGKNSRAPAN